jgi:pimeloyl-ACP methyl ester carboxylesterase
MGAPMEKVPFSMRIAAVPGLGRLMARVPPTRGAVRMILRQIGLKAALENGRFTDEMLEWFLVMLRHTNTMRNEGRSSPRVITPIRGMNRRMLLPDSLLARLPMPVQLIWGGDDPNGGEEVARAFAARIPNAALEMLPDAGHAPWIDEPETTADLTRAFLGG